MLASLEGRQLTIGLQSMKLGRLVMTVLLLLSLIACSDQNLSDLQSFVSDVKARKGHLDPIPVFDPVEQYAYQSDDKKDPFTTWKTAVAKDISGPREGGEAGPDVQRQTEELEAFPLDTLRMKGILEMKGIRWGLIRAADGIIHRVRVGNYMGQNYGKITAVELDRVVLLEIVPNGLGGWERKEMSLTLNTEE